MRDMGDGQRAKARALMPEVARIVKPTQPAMGPRAVVTAPGTVRNYKKGGAVHSDVKQDKAMIRGMVKPSALKKAHGGAATARAMSYGSDAGTKVERMASGGAGKRPEVPKTFRGKRPLATESRVEYASGGAAARANAKPGSSAGTSVERMKKGGACKMADGGIVPGTSNRSAGTPKPAPRTPSGGMVPAAEKPARFAAGGVAKVRRGVATPAGKPAPLPKGKSIPVNMGPRNKSRRGAI